MNVTALVLLALNYALILSLPFVFFERRDRRRAAMWWVAAAPFILLPALIAWVGLGWASTVITTDDPVARALSAVAVMPSAASIALVASALAVNHRRLAQWHQRDDLPHGLVTCGPYARVRHPFYLAYLLMFLAAALIVPSTGVIAAFLYAAVVLDRTAAREERRIRGSDLGDRYLAYMSRTGRFLPLPTWRSS